MQKRLLLVAIAINCSLMYANNMQDTLLNNNENSDAVVMRELTAQEKEEAQALQQELADYERQRELLHKTRLIKEELADYENQKIIKFKAALLAALVDNPTAIDDLAKENETEFNTEETDSLTLQDDTILGSGGWVTGAGAQPTTKTINGRIKNYIQQRKKGKSEINARLKKDYTNYKDTFNGSVMVILEKEVVHKNYEMENTFLRGLDRCGLAQECLLENNVSLPVIRKDGFFDRFCFATFKPVIDAARKEAIPLTDDQIIELSRKKIFKRKEINLSMESLDESKIKVLVKLDALLNAQK